ncbi:MAG: hypothetical protein HY273_08995 [Gammaproteobacteria bacterium]|nr:hypothetical protein [Gammaproteobacteria bacterium]
MDKISTLLCALGVFLTGCGDSSFSNHPAAPQGASGSGSITVTGTVWAKSGTLGVPRTAGLQQLLNWIAGEPALAAPQSLAPVAAVNVALYALDSSGAILGDALAATQTDASGAYSLNLTADPSVLLLAKAEGIESLIAFVTGPVIDITPMSAAAVAAVTRVTSNLALLSTAELEQIAAAVHAAYSGINPNDAMNNAGLVTALAAAAVDDEEIKSLILNSAATQRVCGSVTDTASGALADVVVAARDFNDQVMRAQTKTGADGAYCLDLQAGDYIVGARNLTSASYAMSEWFTANGGVPEQHNADKVTITSGDPVKTINFELAQGGRLSGKVTARAPVTMNGNTWLAGDALKNIQIAILNYDNHFIVESLPTGDAGAYQVNLAPGDYLVMATNRTLQPYASEAFDGANGTNIQQRATRVTVTDNQTRSADLQLDAGKAITGQVKNNSGAGAPGQPVYIGSADDGSAAYVRTDLAGKYCVWLKPSSYRVHSRGQTANLDLTTASTPSADFGAPMSEVAVKLVEAANPAKPISGALLVLRIPASWDVASQERTRGDGTAILYSPYDAAAHLNYYYLETKFDTRQYLASQLYDGKLNKAAADVIAIPSEHAAHDLGTVQIAVGGILTGRVVLNDATTVAPNQPVQIRQAGITAADLLVKTQTNGDGSFSVSLPAGHYARIVLGNTDGNNCTNDCSVNLDNSVDIAAGQITSLGEQKLR